MRFSALAVASISVSLAAGVRIGTLSPLSQDQPSFRSGVQTVAEITRTDPELARTALDTSTCQQLHAERNQ